MARAGWRGEPAEHKVQDVLVASCVKCLLVVQAEDLGCAPPRAQGTPPHASLTQQLRQGGGKGRRQHGRFDGRAVHQRHNDLHCYTAGGGAERAAVGSLAWTALSTT